MLRDAVARGTALGREVEATLAAGGLVPDDLIIRVVEDRLQLPDTAAGFVLDDLPRTLPQALALDRVMSGRGALIVIYLDVSPDVIINRILSRRIWRKLRSGGHRRTDDSNIARPAAGPLSSALTITS